MSTPAVNQDKRGHSHHQNEAHRVLRDAGYAFSHEGSHNSNVYFNERGQKVVALCSPRNNSQALNNVRNKIHAHAREIAQQEAHMNAETQVSTADQYVAMANEFLTKPLGPEDHQKSPAYRAKYAAYVQWLRRVLERNPGSYALDVEEATKRLGFTPSWLQRARKELAISPVHARGTTGEPGKWQLYLPHDVPAGRKARAERRQLMGNPPPGVQVVREDAPPEHAIERVLEAVSNGNGNGKHLTDQQAAALMLLESLGIQSPGEEAKAALVRAEEALRGAHEAVLQAQRALA